MGEMSLVKKNYVNFVNNAIKNNKIFHAYLFEIDDYDKDFSYILNFAKMILVNCSYRQISEIDNPIFNMIDQNNYLDVCIIEPDGNNIKKNQVIGIQKEYNNKSLLDGKRIYIIKNAEKMNVAAANTMLKFLEEPEDDIIAFLVTSNRYLIIETILSRCQIITLKENSIFFDVDDKILKLLNCVLCPQNFFVKYKQVIDIYSEKTIVLNDLKVVENIIISFMNDRYKITNLANEAIVSLLCDKEDAFLLNRISIIEGELPKLDFNVNYKLWLDSLFSKLIIGGCV